MYINAIGHYVPENRVENSYFEKVNGLTPEWIVQRTGIETRSKAAPDENVNTMAFKAIDDALARLPYDIKETDLIVAASYTAYDTVATPAHEAQCHYGIHGAKALYLSAACSSFINGLEVVEGYFAMGKATKALLICSEQNSYYANEKDPKSGHLWGDGAVAYFISKDKIREGDSEILNVFTQGLGDVGKGPDGVRLRPKEGGISMPDGRDVFLHACKNMIYALRTSLNQTKLNEKDIKYHICHQANKRIVAQVAHILDMPMDKFLNNIEQLGNTGSASAPLVLSQNVDKFSAGDKASLMVFGGGYSCGSVIIKMGANQVKV